jgi:hypothetical protein
LIPVNIGNSLLIPEFAAQGMQLARLPTAAGVGGLGGAIVSTLVRSLANYGSPPLPQPVIYATDPALPAAATCTCPSLVRHLGSWVKLLGIPHFSLLAIVGILLFGLVLGAAVGLLVGLSVAFVLGRNRAAPPPQLRDRVGSYRS